MNIHRVGNKAEMSDFGAYPTPKDLFFKVSSSCDAVDGFTRLLSKI